MHGPKKLRSLLGYEFKLSHESTRARGHEGLNPNARNSNARARVWPRRIPTSARGCALCRRPRKGLVGTSPPPLLGRSDHGRRVSAARARITRIDNATSRTRIGERDSGSMRHGRDSERLRQVGRRLVLWCTADANHAMSRGRRKPCHVARRTQTMASSAADTNHAMSSGGRKPLACHVAQQTQTMRCRAADANCFFAQQTQTMSRQVPAAGGVPAPRRRRRRGAVTERRRRDRTEAP